MKITIRFFSVFLFVALLHGPAHAGISIAVTGSWYETVNKNDLLFGAGSDLQSTYTSVSGQVLIDISDTTGSTDAWRVDIWKIDDNWDNRLYPWVRRTSDGTGGSVNGGGSFQEITDISTSFFSGAGNVTGINVQLRLTGASVQISPSSYTTVIYYTVVDIQ